MRRKGLVAVAAAVGLVGCSGSPMPQGATDAPGGGAVFTVAYNGDAANHLTIEPVLASISETLGIETDSVVYPDFKSLRDAVVSGEVGAAFRSGWQADYPSLENFLEPLYYTNAAANDGGYSSAEFDSLMDQAVAVTSEGEAFSLLHQAEEVLLRDLPAIPLMTPTASGVWGPQVTDVAVGWQSIPIYAEVAKTSGDGVVAAFLGEPQNPLIPSEAGESFGGAIIDLLFAQLFSIDAENRVFGEAAEGIASEDNTTWTIEIRPDQVFSDGSPVTADSFINAWDDAALASNGRSQASFFERIKGFSYDKDSHIAGEGLKKVDNLTFIVELVGPVADFPIRLCDVAFSPLPASAFDADGRVTSEFGEHPIGNGPYVLEKWTHDEEALLLTNPTYSGPQKVANQGVRFVFYRDLEAAYADVKSGALDILPAIPDSAWETFTLDFPDSYFFQAAAVIQTITIPQDLAHFSGEEGRLRRAALSMAIDREAIFGESAFPATDFTSHIIPGWSDEIPGREVLTYNPERARELWEQANSISPWPSKAHGA
ncbi:MAG: ABC transporter substrate-binding protein [Micrococcales bacterium]|nr:ABC transporter substrate-binding protein [Micrococcales bacterium]